MDSIAKKVLEIANSPIPRTLTGIARGLVSAGVFSTKYPNKLAPYLRRKYIDPLVQDSYLIVFEPGTESWDNARALVRMYSSIKPRRVGELYQTNFVYAFSPVNMVLLPRVPQDLNLAAMAFSHKLSKRIGESQFGILLFNFILSGREPEFRNMIRLYMYKRRIDFDDLDLMEKFLDFGLKLDKFPFKPDSELAKQFVDLVEIQNTGSRGAVTQ